MGILANICDKLSSEEDVINLIKSNSKERIYQLLTGVTNEN
jgi:mannitol/fructose-specific phosphotransferase system IIA component (Ntr-type)